MAQYPSCFPLKNCLPIACDLSGLMSLPSHWKRLITHAGATRVLSGIVCECWEREVPFSAENATRRDRRWEAAGGILTCPVVRACLAAEGSQHRPAGATSFEPLKTAVPETQMVVSWICDWFQSGESWLKLGGWLTAASQGVCGFGTSC